jgi:Domain of unknown function (DUF4139)/N-terminal domain of unknown function (DUF4140)
MVALICESMITHVNVYARGAVVTRRLILPHTLPDGDIALSIEGVTMIAEPTSLRASLPDDCKRSVLAVRSAVMVPASDASLSDAHARVEALTADVQKHLNMLGHLRAQLTAIEEIALSPGMQARAKHDSSRDVVRRVAETCATENMLDGLSKDLIERIVGLEQKIEDLENQQRAERLAISQTETNVRAGKALPTLRATVQIMGTGTVSWVDVTYVVEAARWWPVYTLRMRDNGRNATWIAEALVAQCSGERWENVKLSLSTSDLLFDARLPELPSLRLGKQQTPKRAYREAPKGLEEMFKGYDRVFESVDESAIATSRLPSDLGMMTSMLQYEQHGSLMSEDAELLEVDQVKEEVTASGFAVLAEGRTSKKLDDERPVVLASMAAPSAAKGAGIFRSRAPGSAMRALSADSPVSIEEELSVEPAEEWFDFDALVLRPASHKRLRGRLERATDHQAGVLQRRIAKTQIESVHVLNGARDPRDSRGMFDHRYEVQGVAEVPSDGRTHRVPVATAESASTVKWRTVPREVPEVYREAELRNPFDAPLLSGPVDVYLDGSLLAIAEVHRIDRGGTMHVGMGIEPRIRVARNVRAREETAGILSGDALVFHDVTLELSSALGTSALVEVIDRLPVTDDKTVEIELTKSVPEAEPYKQIERGTPVRGGSLWHVIVPAGGKGNIAYSYKIRFPSKNEIVGGNRRD